MKRSLAILAMAVVLVTGTAGIATATTISFDEGVNSNPAPAEFPTYLPPPDSPIASTTRLTWDGTGELYYGHLYCASFAHDSIIYFSSPTYVNSFQMNGMPATEISNTPVQLLGFVFGPMTIEAYNGAGALVWSTTIPEFTPDPVLFPPDVGVDDSWLTVDVNTADVAWIIFRAVNPIDWEKYPITGVDPNGPTFTASIDNLVINESAVVPIPASLWLLGSGLLGLLGLRRKWAR
jgi:hypothetical protein